LASPKKALCAKITW